MSYALADAVREWPEAEPLIAAALLGSDDSTEEVLDACRRGEAWMLASERGYAVLKAVAAPRGFDVLVWVAVSRGARDCIATQLNELETLARAAGARSIVFRSSRRGFERALPAGWAVRQITMARTF
jgi:hypothetical protein